MILFKELTFTGKATIPIYLRERKGSSRITMSYSTTKRHVVIAAPKRTTKTFLTDFIKKHIDWIEKQVAKHGDGSKEFAPGVIVPFRGNAHTLTHEESNRVLVKVDGDVFFVRAATKRIDTHVRRWLMKEAASDVEKESVKFAKKLGVTIAKITVKSMHTRWGSCSSAGNLNYNWRLIFAPESILSYVCAHEVCHRIHMNHSKAFWDTVAKICPDYELARAWLRKNGSSLYAFG
jgi:predicted metal-dependent hydrolase